MYRFLLTPRWLAGLALAVLLALACVALGTWQWDRREQARDRNAPVLANYDAAPRPLAEVRDAELADGRLDRMEQWTPVRATGTYRPADTLLVRNRSLEGRPGYQALVPLGLPDGTSLLVNRGWVPTGSDGGGPDSLPSPPTGEVDVVVRLRPPEPALDRTPPAGQLYTIDLPAVADLLGDPDLETAAFGVLAGEQPAPDRTPVALPRPVVDEGPHLSYSLQWFVFAAGVLIGYGVLARRTAHDLRAEAADVPAPSRPSRRRPTAEEEEDALLDAAEQRPGPLTSG